MGTGHLQESPAVSLAHHWGEQEALTLGLLDDRLLTGAEPSKTQD